MKVGILGGSFDPPHLGHLLVARQTREIVSLDEVWLMPYFAHGWDPVVASAQDRLAMAKLLEERGVVVSEEEIHRGEKSYTIDTVHRLKSRHTHSFFWIVGSDVLAQFPKWKQSQQLVREVRFLVFPRNGYPLPAHLPTGFLPVTSTNLVTSNISSSLVRSRLQRGLSVVGLIPEAVLSYIQKRHLYFK